MLNFTAIREAMQTKGWNQSELAERCGVSREAVSRWLAGESVPRPSKLKLLSDRLEVEVVQLVAPRAGPTCIADAVAGTEFSTTTADRYALEDQGWRLYDLEPFVPVSALFQPLKLVAPVLDVEYLEAVATRARRSIGVEDGVPLRTHHLIELAQAAGVRLLPIAWAGDRPGQSHTLRIDWPEEFLPWLVFGTNIRQLDLDAALAHVVGVQYASASLSAEDAEAFGRAFAQVLCAHGVYRHADAGTTVKQSYFQDEELPPQAFIEVCERAFGTPVYAALQEFQRHEGGRNPAFIAALLNIGLAAAVDLSFATLH